jgi:hypothetical protein
VGAVLVDFGGTGLKAIEGGGGVELRAPPSVTIAGGRSSEVDGTLEVSFTAGATAMAA